MQANLFAVGKVVGCFGIKGYVKVQPSTHSVERLHALKEIYLGTASEKTVVHAIEDVVLHQQNVRVKLSAIDDRTAAEKIVGQFLFVQEQDVEPPAQGSYFIHDVIGCEVWTTEGRCVGSVEDVYKSTGQDLWAIRTKTGLQLIPAVKDFIQDVDTKQKKVVLKLIDGLIQE